MNGTTDADGTNGDAIDGGTTTPESPTGGTTDADTTTGTGAGYPWTPDALARIRRDPTSRGVALVVAVVVGVAVAWLHWLGLFVAGALVGLASRTVPRAVAAGLLVGALVLAVFVLASPAMGPGEFLGLAPISYVTVAAALVAPVWGSLVRAVV